MRNRIWQAAVALSVSVGAGMLNGQNFAGAIYTSLGDGTVINHNLYNSKSDVYLNGGPQNQNSAGLPNGTYYFQVTDPSGTLLSTDDAICRQLTVANGVVSGASPLSGACAHANGQLNILNGSIPVQLIPYNDTPNPGGEYKVWLIQKSCNAGDPTVSGPEIDFRPSCSKTDNFKVRLTPPPSDCPAGFPDCHSGLRGLKYYDSNANGARDGVEPVQAGFRFNANFGGVAQGNSPVTSAGDGTFAFTGLTDLNTYQVCELLPSPNPNGSYWLQTQPALGGGGYSAKEGVDVDPLVFGNVCLKPASGGFTLGFWSNKNGQARLEANGQLANRLLDSRIEDSKSEYCNKRSYAASNLTMSSIARSAL